VGLLVLNGGVSTTVQDRGRPGYREWGVPVGGAFDRDAHDLANALLGNPGDAATLELTLVGGRYEARIPLAISLAGAPMEATVRTADGRVIPLQPPRTILLAPRDTLVLGGTPAGARTYLGVKGGWRTPPVLGSRSSETPVKAGDLLPANPGAGPARRLAGPLSSNRGDPRIRLVPGPDFPALARPECIVEGAFRVGRELSRTGIRLDGMTIDVSADPLRVSAPVAPGAVQVAGGRIILLGVACGTMGGYPHVAHVLSADLSKLAQLREGATVRFRLVTIEEAREIDRDHRRRAFEILTRVGVIASDA
jgi:biotin-dependent carboxylase-like uncharacterized protein